MSDGYINELVKSMSSFEEIHRHENELKRQLANKKEELKDRIINDYKQITDIAYKLSDISSFQFDLNKEQLTNFPIYSIPQNKQSNKLNKEIILNDFINLHYILHLLRKHCCFIAATKIILFFRNESCIRLFQTESGLFNQPPNFLSYHIIQDQIDNFDKIISDHIDKLRTILYEKKLDYEDFCRILISLIILDDSELVDILENFIKKQTESLIVHSCEANKNSHRIPTFDDITILITDYHSFVCNVQKIFIPSLNDSLSFFEKLMTQFKESNFLSEISLKDLVQFSQFISYDNYSVTYNRNISLPHSLVHNLLLQSLNLINKNIHSLCQDYFANLESFIEFSSLLPNLKQINEFKFTIEYAALPVIHFDPLNSIIIPILNHYFYLSIQRNLSKIFVEFKDNLIELFYKPGLEDVHHLINQTKESSNLTSFIFSINPVNSIFYSSELDGLVFNLILNLHEISCHFDHFLSYLDSNDFISSNIDNAPIFDESVLETGLKRSLLKLFELENIELQHYGKFMNSWHFFQEKLASYSNESNNEKLTRQASKFYEILLQKETILDHLSLIEERFATMMAEEFMKIVDDYLKDVLEVGLISLSMFEFVDEDVNNYSFPTSSSPVLFDKIFKWSNKLTLQNVVEPKCCKIFSLVYNKLEAMNIESLASLEKKHSVIAAAYLQLLFDYKWIIGLCYNHIINRDSQTVINNHNISQSIKFDSFKIVGYLQQKIDPFQLISVNDQINSHLEAYRSATFNLIDNCTQKTIQVPSAAASTSLTSLTSDTECLQKTTFNQKNQKSFIPFIQ